MRDYTKYQRARVGTPEWRLYCLGRVGEALKTARDWAKGAKAPQLKQKIDSGIKSLGGAIRHAERMQCASAATLSRRRRAARS